MMRRTPAVVFGALAVLAASGVLLFSRHGGGDLKVTPKRKLVLYCATDREVAQDVIDAFQRETGIAVDAKYDTEAARAVGLVQAVRQERSHPQADVLWGGGPFFASMLADDGCLAPAPADLIASVGATPRDGEGRWLGFAGVYRVLIVNTDVMPKAEERPKSIWDLTDPRYKGHVGIANPLFGGSAGQVSAIFAMRGEAEGRRWLAGLKANDVAICAGMADVRNRVASGELWFGITSTIDAHVAMVGGKPVAVVYPDQGEGQMGCINGYGAAMKIAGGPHPGEADAFMRFLITPRTERIMSEGPGQNIGMLPGSVEQGIRPAWIPRDVRTMDVDWGAAAAAFPAATRAVREILMGGK